MTTVTKLRFESGDRAVLDDVVDDVKRMIERKGGECNGPHSDPPDRLTVPLYHDLQPGDRLEPWTYAVYTRRLEIQDNERIVRAVGHAEFPDSVRVEIEVERRRSVGSG